MNKGEANSYKTGHKPKETYEELIRRVTGNSFFMPGTDVAKKPSKKRKKLSKVERLLAMAEELEPAQVQLILDVIKGDKALVTHDRQTFAVWRIEGGWKLHGLFEAAKERVVLEESWACTCEDNKFRGNVCKHIIAIRSLV